MSWVVQAYPLGHPLDEPLRYTVIFVRCAGRWLFVRHRERQTWECPGGHIEPHETPLAGAARELYEESGLRCPIIPVSEYYAADGERHGYGRIYLALAQDVAQVPADFEMAEARLFDGLPAEVTYPEIYACIFPIALDFLRARQNIGFAQTLAMSRELWEQHRDTWSPMTMPYARNSLLWMMGEMGEVIDIVKKLGETQIEQSPKVRADLVEELVDVHMYFNDILNRYGISATEFAAAYHEKHQRNMRRDYEKEALRLK